MTNQKNGVGPEDSIPPAEEGQNQVPESRMTALATEPVLRQIWDTPEEDAAWAYLQKE